jgi:hypothetical protein
LFYLLSTDTLLQAEYDGSAEGQGFNANDHDDNPVAAHDEDAAKPRIPLKMVRTPRCADGAYFVMR